MTALFDRRCEVYVGVPPKEDVFTLQTVERLRIAGLRIGFKIVRDASAEPNNLELVVYNLSEASRARFEEKGARVVVLAGYREQLAQLCSGDIRHAQSMKAGSDWVTKIEAGDGERALAHARVSESWRPGTQVSSVVAKAVQALQLDPGNALTKAKEIAGEFSSGYVQHGKASRELSSLLEPRGYTWSVQDGRIEILKSTETLPETAPLISPDSGLIGSPEMGTPTKPGAKPVLKIRSLLQPRLRPKQRFELKSRTRSGVFVAQKVTHTGDTFGNDWYTDIEATVA
jgi:hypothetical protein